MMIEFKTTARGFTYGTFTDLYGAECSIQNSSLATDDAIWLGIDDPNPMIMASQASAYGVDTDETTGWVPYPIPKEVLITTRMHLNKKMAKELVKQLNKFIKDGYV